ncbi:MAG: hypothetical protein AAGL90_07980 [Pseudomonadota bacterium]
MTLKQTDLQTYPFIVDQAKMRAAMADFGWRPASGPEIPQLVELGERLITGKLADVAVIERIHAQTGITAWVFGDPIEGLVLCVPLSETGLDALSASAFSPGDPDDAHVAAAGQPCAGMYIGVYAGATHAARKAVMVGAGLIRMHLFSQVPCFARAATEDGARSMVSLGWAPANFGIDKLWMQGALTAPETQVA